MRLLLLVLLVGFTFAASPVFAGDNASIVVVAPPTVESGATFQITVVVTNTGTTTWSREANYCIGFGDGTPTEGRYTTVVQQCGPIISQAYPWPDPSWDDGNRIWPQEGDQIAPGQSRTYTATMQAPVNIVPFTSLVCSATVRMVIENGYAQGWPDGWFGTPAVYIMGVTWRDSSGGSLPPLPPLP